MATTAAELIVRVGADVDGALRGLDQVDRRIGSFTAGALRAVKFLGAGVAVGLTGAVKAAGDFQQQLNILEAVGGQAAARMMPAIRREAVALGKDMSLPATSAKDAAEAMTELVKGGLSVRDAMAAARGVLQMSAAAEISNADAATITARALNAFGLAGREATRVADVLANAANASTGEISDFALGLQQSSAVAAQAGLSINDTVAALMELANKGITASDAGTSLKTMLMRLTPTSQEAAATMRALGVNVYDSHGRFVGIREAIRQYHEALSRLTPEQRAAALQTIFGSDAIRAANVILGEGVSAFDRYRSATERSGAAADLAAARMKGFKGAVEGLRSNIETLAIQLGTPLLGAAERATRALSSLVDWLGRVAAAKGWDIRVRMVVEGGREALAQARLIAGRIAESVERALAAADWSRVGEAIATGVVAAVEAAGTIASGLGRVLTAAITRIDVAAVSKTFGTVMLLAFARAFADLLDPLFWIHHFDALLGVVASVIMLVFAPARLVRAIPLAGAFLLAIREAVGPTVRALVGFLGELGVTLSREFVRVVLPDAVAAAARLPVALRTGWASAVSELAALLRRLAAELGMGLGMVAADALRLAAEVGRSIIGGVLSGLAGLAERLGLRAAGEVAAGVANAAKAAVVAAAELGRSVADGILSGLSGLAKSVYDRLAGPVLWAVGKLKDAIRSHSPSGLTRDEIGRPLGEGIILGYLLGTRDLPSRMAQSVRDAIERAKQQVESLRGVMDSAWSRVADSALRAFDAQTQAGLDRIRSRYDALRSQVDAFQAEATPEEKALADFRAQRQADEEARRYREAQAALAKAEAEQDEQAIADAKEQIRQLDLDRQERALEQAAELSRQARDQEAARRRAALDAEQAEAEKQYQAQRDLERSHFEQRLSDLQAFLDAHPAMWQQANDQLMKLLRSFGVDYRAAAAALGNAFAVGLHEQLAEAYRTTLQWVNAIRKVLGEKPVQPAKLPALPKLPSASSQIAAAGREAAATVNVTVNMDGATLIGSPDPATARKLADVVAPAIRARPSLAVAI